MYCPWERLMSSGGTMYPDGPMFKYLAQRAAVLTEVLCDFCHFVQPNTGRVPYARLSTSCHIISIHYSLILSFNTT